MTDSTTTTTTTYDYDYVVIGGGSGGVSSAKRAAMLYQKKVAIVEGARWGGTCVNVGCVPKKIMYQAANLYEMMRHDMPAYEISKGSGEASPTFDWKTLKDKRDAYIVRLNNIYLNGLKSAGVTVIEGWASLTGRHQVHINMNDGTSQTITAEHILIAVGGKPLVPPGEGVAEHTITSDGFFALEQQPKKAVVVGAGYIAVELAGVFHGLGTETHLVVRKGRALREFDPDISEFLDATMVKQGIAMHRNTDGVAKVELAEDGTKTVTCVNGEVITGANVVLMAPGRIPDVERLGLKQVGVELTDKSYVRVDEYQNTTVPGIYAVGDVAGKIELTPMAIAAGRRLADRLFGPAELYFKAKTSYEQVPTVVFSHPTIGAIGVTEPQAVLKYGPDNIKVYRSTFVNLHYSMFSHLEPADKPKTLVKLICAGIEERVVGLHIIGMAADEMLQGFGIAMKMGATKADFDACIAIHPTAAEEVVTLGTWGTSPLVSGAAVSPLMGAPAAEPTLANSPTTSSKM